jgi:CRP/FNR family transcriptional regulator
MDQQTLEARKTALQLCRMFQSLPQDDLTRLAQFVEYRAFEKGAYLFLEGDPSEGFYIVQMGAVNVHRIGPDGREKVIYIFREGESFGEATLADRSGYPAHALVVESSRLLFIPREPFLGLIHDRPEFAMRILASMSQHLRVLVNSLDDITYRDLETRLAYWLLRRCPTPYGADPVEIQLDVSKNTLASELHVRQETLSRVLKRWKDLGVVESSGRKIIINNPLQLEAMLQVRIEG